MLTSALVISGCVSTSDLTGGVGDGGVSSRCTGPACSDAAACSADVQTDNANCGACGNACGAGMSCAAGKCIVGCAGGTMYVSTSTGNDSSDGCTEAHPKKTITSALTALTTTPALAKEVHVCRGTYVEAISVNTSVALLGAYDCTDWRRTANYGYPTFDNLNQTTVQSPSVNPGNTTLSVGTNHADANARLDGFRIVGPSVTAGNAPSVALTLSLSTMVRVTNNDIAGPSGSNAETHGIDISFTAAPEVAHNRIDGGNGQNGAQGVLVNGASPLIHDNVISSGSSLTNNVIGLNIVSGTTLVGVGAVRNNTIRGGNGYLAGAGYGSVGLRSEGPVEAVGNVIEAGVTSCAAGLTCRSVGVLIEETAGAGAVVTLAGNRIFGGSTAAGTDAVFGVVVGSAGPTLLVNNAIQAGNTKASPSVAVSLQGTASARVVQNTLYGSKAGIDVNALSSVSALNNLILGDVASSQRGALVDNECNRTVRPAVSAFSGNALIDFGTTLAAVQNLSGSTCSATFLQSLAAIAAAEPSASATGNVRFAGTCSADDGASCIVESACATTTDPSACISLVLATWDDASQGAADLLSDGLTWKLSSAASCKITQGAVAIPDAGATGDAGVESTAFDITGRARTTPFSIGAYESDAPCQ